MPEYRNPTPTVDIIIEKNHKIVLVKRKNPPYGWALPGGFVDEGEWIENAAIREAKEETQLDIVLDELFYVYSDPQRDPRQHTMSTVFLAHAEGTPSGNDDAEVAQYFDLDNLPSPICFDHAVMIDDYIYYKATKQHRQIQRYNDTMVKKPS